MPVLIDRFGIRANLAVQHRLRDIVRHAEAILTDTSCHDLEHERIGEDGEESQVERDPFGRGAPGHCAGCVRQRVDLRLPDVPNLTLPGPLGQSSDTRRSALSASWAFRARSPLSNREKAMSGANGPSNEASGIASLVASDPSTYPRSIPVTKPSRVGCLTRSPSSSRARVGRVFPDEMRRQGRQTREKIRRDILHAPFPARGCCACTIR